MQIDYYCALTSPWSYMGHGPFCDMARRAGADVRILPVNALAVFDRTGGLPLPKRSPERQAYRFQELARWRKRHNVDLNLRPAHFPTDETQAALLVVTAREAGLDALDLAGRFMRAVWAEERNISDADTIAKIVGEAGLDLSQLTEHRENVDAAALRDQAGEAAIQAGVFGVPTYHFGDEMFWGQDRLSFVEEKLAGGR